MINLFNKKVFYFNGKKKVSGLIIGVAYNGTYVNLELKNGKVLREIPTELCVLKKRQ